MAGRILFSSISILVLTLLVCASESVNSPPLCTVSPRPGGGVCLNKCCPHGSNINMTSGECALNTTDETLTINNACVYRKLIAGSYKYLHNATLLVEDNNQTLNNNEFCVEWVNSSSLLPFKCISCRDNVSELILEVPRNYSNGSIELKDGSLYPSGYWWYDISEKALRVCDTVYRIPVRKCCPKDESILDFSGNCGGISDNSSHTVKNIKLILDNPCKFGKKVVNNTEIFVKNGTLYMPKHPGEVSYNLCIDWVDSVKEFRSFHCVSCHADWSEVVNVDDTEMLTNGSVSVRNGRVYNSSEWWREQDSETSSIRVCGCIHEHCIRKCCNSTSIMDPEGPCVETNETLTATHMNGFKMIPVDPCRQGRYMLYPPGDIMDTYEFLNDGMLLLPNMNNLTLRTSEYCVDKMEVDGEFYVFPCFPEDTEDTQEARYTLYPVGMLTSEPFLLATMLVYAVIPELRNLHGLTLMSHVSILFLGYLLLAVVQLAKDAISDTTCIVSAFIIYFSFLASFFWLNVMCLDIWWTFSGFRPMQGSVKEREQKKFIIYSLYCWGSPTVMLVIAMLMDMHPDIPDTILKPGFGKRSCWFGTDEANLYYFLGPIAFLIIVNIVLFVATAVKIRKLKNETKILTKKESKRHDVDENNSQRFNLYLKLFLVMGVNWVMEVISWAAGGPQYLWYVTDIGNTLQGVLIFIIFVWKDRIRRLLMERFCPKRAMSSSTRSAVTMTRSITSTGVTGNSTLKNKASVKSTNHEEYRMKPLMENSCVETEVA